MAPLKFEDKIKEKLEQREIQPSKSSWDTLSAQLDKAQEGRKTTNNKYWWYSLAAVFVGVLILTSVLYNSPIVENQNQQIVDKTEGIKEQVNTEIVQKSNDQFKNVEEKENKASGSKEIKKEALVNTVSKTKVAKKNIDIKNAKFKKDVILEDENKNIKPIEVAENKTEVIETPKEAEILEINQQDIQNKVEDVIAQVNALKNNNREVTDEEIDALLRKAQRDITSKRILKSNTVSASALLQDVEEEIDETFKQRVFEALKLGFQKVKTAVAEREN